MGRTATTGGGGITPMWRSVNDIGEAIQTDDSGLYKLVEPDPNDSCVPPRGTRAKLRLSGISEAFPMPTFNDASKMEDKVRVEFLVVDLRGKNIEWMKGKRFTQIMTDKISPKSNMGKLFQALSDRPIPENQEGFPYDGWIDTQFVALVGESQNGQYAVVNPEAIETDKTVLSPAVQAYFSSNGTAPKPEKALAGVAASGADEEFVGDDDL